MWQLDTPLIKILKNLEHIINYVHFRLTAPIYSQVTQILISSCYLKIFSNHQLNLVCQTFLVNKGIQYLCHWPCISNGFFYQKNVRNLKISLYLIPFLSSFPVLHNFFSNLVQNSSQKCSTCLHCFQQYRFSSWKITGGEILTIFIVSSCFRRNGR